MGEKQTDLVRVRKGDIERLDAIGTVLTKVSGQFTTRADVEAYLLDGVWNPHYESALRALRKRRKVE